MATLEERVSILEVKVDEHSRAVGELRDLIDRRFDILDQKFTWLLGLQVTMLLAFLTASFGAIGILLTC